VDYSPNPERWILVVEDNEDDERLARRSIEKSKRLETVTVARDGTQALALLMSGPPPALVLLDLKLPRLSGMDVLSSIREDERLKTLPIVILTSSDHISDVAACFNMGCNAFVRKAIEFEDYMSELAKTLEFWLDINCPPPIALPPAEVLAEGANGAYVL
jgi:CheY-like chemotaxis protein